MSDLNISWNAKWKGVVRLVHPQLFLLQSPECNAWWYIARSVTIGCTLLFTMHCGIHKMGNSLWWTISSVVLSDTSFVYTAEQLCYCTSHKFDPIRKQMWVSVSSSPKGSVDRNKAKGILKRIQPRPRGKEYFVINFMKSEPGYAKAHHDEQRIWLWHMFVTIRACSSGGEMGVH